MNPKAFFSLVLTFYIFFTLYSPGPIVVDIAPAKLRRAPTFWRRGCTTGIFAILAAINLRCTGAALP